MLGEHYHCSETPVFKAMWNSYNNCQFVEDTGTCSRIFVIHEMVIAVLLARLCAVLP